MIFLDKLHGTKIELTSAVKVKRTEQICYKYKLVSHTIVVKTYPGYKIGLRKFCELKPNNIKLLDHIPHNICVCSYHENVQLLLLSLKEHEHS